MQSPTDQHDDRQPESAGLSDAELAAGLAAGDRRALGELVRRHQHRALELAYRTIGDRSLAEDIAQEAFLRVWRSAPRYKPTAKFTTWLYRIVVNLCLDSMKKRQPIVGDPPERAGDLAERPDNILECGERSLAVRRAVDKLPERQRIAVVLHRFSGEPIKEVARITGWTESAVESLLVRAYSSLRNSLRELGGS